MTELKKHTKEPWFLSPIGDLIIVQSKFHSAIANMGYSKTEQNEIDGKRIVACVNACAGITNEALEAGIIKDSVNLHADILDQQPSSFFKEYGVKVWEDA